MWTRFVPEEVLTITKLPSGASDEILQPSFRASLARDAQLLVADHIE